MNKIKRILFIVIAFIMISCKSSNIPSSVIVDMDEIAYDKGWNNHFLELKDSSYSIWKNKLSGLLSLELTNLSEDDYKKIKTIYIQQYKIYREDIAKDGFSKPITRYLIPCTDSANLMVFPPKSKNNFLAKMCYIDGQWRYYLYKCLDASYEKVESILKVKRQRIFMLDMISKNNERDVFIAYINKMGQLMYIVENEKDRLLELDSKEIIYKNFL